MKKVCSKCKEEKDWSEFYIRSDNKRPLSHCKVCLSETNKQNRERRREIQKKYESKPEVKERVSRRRKERYQNDLDYRERVAKQSKEWVKTEKGRDYHLRRTYGITLDQYNELLEKQNHRCKICKRHQSELTQRLAVDHNHETLEIRGLLCSNCNHRVVGRHKKGDLLRAAADYLDGEYTGWFAPPKKKRKKRAKRKSPKGKRS